MDMEKTTSDKVWTTDFDDFSSTANVHVSDPDFWDRLNISDSRFGSIESFTLDGCNVTMTAPQEMSGAEIEHLGQSYQDIDTLFAEAHDAGEMVTHDDQDIKMDAPRATVGFPKDRMHTREAQGQDVQRELQDLKAQINSLKLLLRSTNSNHRQLIEWTIKTDQNFNCIADWLSQNFGGLVLKTEESGQATRDHFQTSE